MPAADPYGNLKLEIQKSGDGYETRLSLISSMGNLETDWHACGDDSILKQDVGIWLGDAGLLKYGKQLFDWLTHDPKMAKAWNTALVRCPQRRIRLVLFKNELAQVPWELLNVTGDEKGWVAGDNATPFSRLLVGDSIQPEPIKDRPIRILVAISNPPKLPAGLTPVPVQEIWEQIESATQEYVETGQIDLQPLQSPVTLESLEAELQNGYHILLFVGHADTTKVYIRLENKNQDNVPLAKFAAMIGRGIKDVIEMGRPFLRMVTLASCQTADSRSVEISSSLSMQLSQAGLPAILAMQDKVEMKAAIDFTTRFYVSLLKFGQIDRATNEARQKLLTEQSSGAYIPVLFSRLTDNKLLIPVEFKEHQTSEPEMVRIPAGKFFMGANPIDKEADACETSAGWINLPTYWIGKYPVTNEEYAAYIQDPHTDGAAPSLNWKGRLPTPGKERFPVVGVTWHEANAYCKWLAERTGRSYRLPSEAEWEKAARGNKDQRIYPWGDTFDPARCQLDSDYEPGGDNHPQLVEVDRYKAQSPYGCFDMIGNVREWTNTIWGENLHANKSRFQYPWKDDDREKHETADRYFKVYCVLRGGGAGDSPLLLRCSARDVDALDARSQCGFRVARR